MPDISSSLSKREVNARQNTYTKSEIDLKDGAIQAIAEAAQTTADAAEKKNQEQDQLIAELQRSSHSHSNQAVLDKTEQPYTTAERDKLAGLENYTHPTHAAHVKGFYKFASDGEGHVTDAGKVTKKDITDLGIPDKDTNTTYRLVQDGIAINMLGSDGSSSEVGLKPTITKRLYGWINHEVNTDDTGKILIDAYLGASPVRWDSVLTEPTKVKVGYDVDGQVKTLITDFANDILVYNVVSQNCSTTVTGKWNLVEGNANKVYGNNNLVGGEHNQITEHGGSSVVSGYGLYCDAVNQTVLGRYKDTGSVDNAWNSYYGKYVLIIGNGSDSNTGRSNAFAVDWDGNLWCGKDKTSLNAQVASKQDKLTAGTNITISGSAISAKDTTYNDATQSAHGLMTAADKKKLAGIAAGAEVNQNAFSTIATGSARYAATAKQSAFLIDGDSGTSVSLDTKTGRLTVSSHTHDNKAVLDQLSDEQWKFINGAANKAHVHDNKAVLDKTTASYTAADKKKLDGIAAGATKVAVDSALSATSTNPVQNKAVKAALDSKSASGHTHAMITNSALWVSGANNTAKWVKLGTLVSSGNFSNAMIRVWSGDGANGRANQNSSFEVQIKDGWQSTESATKACGVTVYRINCSSVKVKVIPTAHDTYTVWAYMPWGYWNGNYAIYGKYKSWTSQHLIQSEEPEGTGADTAYYDHAFLTSTVANATTWNGLINDVDTYNSSDTWILVKKDNRIQHRYAGELDVNSAKTLVDSGWQKPTFPSGVKSSSIRYRKQGKIVSVTGYVQFSTAQTTITVFTLPTGYRPPAKIQQFNAVDSSAQASFLTKIDTDGKVGFFGKTQGFFTTATEYYMHCTFFVD